jgi:hypothetical protein
MCLCNVDLRNGYPLDNDVKEEPEGRGTADIGGIAVPKT